MKIAPAGAGIGMRKLLIAGLAAAAAITFAPLPMASAAPCGNGAPGDPAFGTQACTNCLQQHRGMTSGCLGSQLPQVAQNTLAPLPIPGYLPGQIPYAPIVPIVPVQPRP
jgi:hypothetical protein